MSALATTDPATLLTGADWITTGDPVPPAGRRPAYVFRRRFRLDAVPSAAWLTATAHGIYEAHLNGTRIGEEELAPGLTSYRHRLYVQRYDVADLLAHGENELTLTVSDGWFRGNCGPRHIPDQFGEQIAVIAALAAGGTTIATGSGWEVGIGEIVAADLMDGQTTDFTRVGATTWSAVVASTDPLTQDRARLQWSPSPVVRRAEAYRPVTITRLPGGRQIVDFGQNLNGWVRLRRLGSAGTVTTLTHGEALDRSGDLTLSNLDYPMPDGTIIGVGQKDVVISRGEPTDVFEPRHTTHGFRYVAIDGLEPELGSEDIEAVQVRSDLAVRGTFHSSDERLNELHRIVRASWRANTCDVPTDCPQRERWGYTGDFQIFARSAAYIEHIDGFSRKWLDALADDQKESGCITNVAPVTGMRLDTTRPISFDGAAGWGDSCTIVPWELYRATGDETVLTDYLPMMVRWVDYAAEAAQTGRHPERAAVRPEPAPHEAYLWDTGWQWGEWLEPATPFDPRADQAVVATAYLANSASIASEVAAMAGDAGLSNRLRTIADGAADAWVREFVGDDGTLSVPSQANYTRGLHFGLFPKALTAAAASRLVELIEAEGDHLSTGFLSTGMLLPVLADHGHADVAFRLLFQHTAPSWMTMIERGATTVWEDWNGVDENDVAHDSLNHYSKGAVIAFLHEYVAGLRPITPGYRTFEVAPLSTEAVSSAEATLETSFGTIVVSWVRTGGDFSLSLTVPEGTRAVVRLPDGTSTHAGPGRHAFTTRQG